MNSVTLGLASIRHQRLASVLTVSLLALGIATIVVVMLFARELEERLTRDARDIDLVVGAKGSPLQLVLSSVFHLDVPTGNIAWEEAGDVARHPMVAASYPLALGDAYAGFRIVGTSHGYVAHYGGALAAGRLWQEEMEVVLGAQAARRTKLGLGDMFTGAHGIAGEGALHEENPYEVVGVLAPTGTVLDRLVLTGFESVWRVHEDASKAAPVAPSPTANGDPSEEITALLVRYRSPLAVVTLPRAINSRSALQAASPAFEVARLLNLVGTGIDIFRVFAGVLIAAAALSLFIAMYSALREQQFDLAVMRTLGASRMRVMWHVLSQGVVLGGIGAIVGLALGHATVLGVQAWLEHDKQLALDTIGPVPGELYVIGLALVVGAVAAVLPAIRAYRLDIARVLGEEG